MEQVAEHWGLNDQRYRVAALLHNLPIATAVIKYRWHKAQIAAIKYITPPRIRPGGVASFLKRIRQQPGVQSGEAARKALERRHARLCGSSGQPPNAVMDQNPFQPKPKSEEGNASTGTPPDDDIPFVF